MRIILFALAAATGLVPVEKSSLDDALVKPGALARTHAMIVDAPTVAYAPHPARSGPISRDEDWQFQPKDLERLQQFFREAFQAELAEAGVEVTDRETPGVARLTPALVDVRLTAPLHEDSAVETFVRSIGDLTLEASIRDSQSGEVVATLRDVRRNVQVSAAPDRGVRFTSTLYWSEVKRVFQHWAEATAALFPERKKP